MRLLRLALFAATAILCALAAGSLRTSSVSAQSAPAMPDDAARGGKIFATNCAVCHGPTGKGSAAGVSLIDSSLVRHDKSGDLITPIIQNGRLEKGMPPFPAITTAQSADVAAFLHHRIEVSDSVETAGPRGGYELQHLLTGNASAGKAYFDTNCASCHSATGDLAGLAKKYRAPELESRFLYPRDVDSSATVTLASGKAFTGEVQHLDAFYVALIGSNGTFHSFSRSAVKLSVHNPAQAHIDLLARYTNKDVHDLFAYLETLQ